MGKAIVNMTNWQLYVHDEEYMLSGMADCHPSMGNDVYVSRTSDLVDYTFENDILTYETRNTIYVCPIKYMQIRPYGNVVVEHRVKLTHRADNSDDILDKIITATAKLSLEILKKMQEHGMSFFDEDLKGLSIDFSEDEYLKKIKKLQEVGHQELEEIQQKENQRLIDIALQYEECVYLEMSNIAEGNTLAYHLGDYKGVVYPDVHVGMYQDSILYLKYAREDDPCSLDFRYFPNGWGDSMETYSWSDNIKIAVLKNDTEGVLTFNHVDIPVGETMVFSQQNHRQGLISPDCYNGKSVIFTPNSEEQ